MNALYPNPYKQRLAFELRKRSEVKSFCECIRAECDRRGLFLSHDELISQKAWL
jgi:hypothetical protein